MAATHFISSGREITRAPARYSAGEGFCFTALGTRRSRVQGTRAEDRAGDWWTSSTWSTCREKGPVFIRKRGCPVPRATRSWIFRHPNCGRRLARGLEIPEWFSFPQRWSRNCAAPRRRAASRLYRVLHRPLGFGKVDRSPMRLMVQADGDGRASRSRCWTGDVCVRKHLWRRTWACSKVAPRHQNIRPIGYVARRRSPRTAASRSVRRIAPYTADAVAPCRDDRGPTALRSRCMWPTSLRGM